MKQLNILKLVMAVMLLGISFRVDAQCDPAKQYDKIVSCYHSSAAQTKAGGWVVWGQDMASNGSSDELAPYDLNSTNYTALKGTVRKVALGGSGSSSGQQFVALSDSGLFVWGNTNSVVATGLRSATSMAKMTTPTGGDSYYKLPTGVLPSQVEQMVASYRTLAILTTGGEVYIITNMAAALQGDGTGSITNTTWHHVQTSSGVYLTGVTAIRLQVTSSTKGACMALTSSGTAYVWGPSVYLGDGNTSTSKSYATAITMPTEFSASNVPKVIGVTGGTNVTSTTTNTFYLLSSQTGIIYSLGYNASRQCGNYSTTEAKNWVVVKKNSTDTIKNFISMSVQEHCSSFPAVAATTDTGDLFVWGENGGKMLGLGTQDSVYDPTYPAGFYPGSDKAIFCELGGHTLVFLKIGSTKYCYVGHKTNGSMGDGISASSYIDTFNCTSTGVATICGMVAVAASTTYSTISASPTTINADGTSTSTITVQLKDATGTNLTETGGTVAITTTSGTISGLVDHNDGTYTATLTSSTSVGAKTISFSIMGTPSPNTTSVTFASCNPIITTEPVNSGVCSGTSTTFGLVASGTGLNYQWQVNTGSSWANATNGGTYSGVTTATLTVSSTTTGMNGYTYRCIVSNTCIPNDTSATVTLNVSTAPVVTNFATSVGSAVCANNAATVTVNSTTLTAGTYTITYNLSGANTATAQTSSITMASNTGTFSVTGTSLATAGTTTVTVTGIRNALGCGVTVSTGNTANITVNASPSVSNFSTSVGSAVCASNAATVTINSTSLSAGTYTVTYNLAGANSATGSTASITMAANTGTFTVPGGSLATSGTTTVTVTGIKNASNCSTTVSSGNTANITVNANPNVSNFSTSVGSSVCSGNAATVTINSTSLTAGTYTVTYNLAGANTATGSTASITMAANTGTFTVPSGSLATAGTTTVTVTGIRSAASCPTTVSSGNTANITVNASPNVSNFSLSAGISPCIGGNGGATINSTTLAAGTYTVTYSLSGANTSSGNTASVTMAANAGSFVIPSAKLASSGATTITVTGMTNGSNCSTTVSSGNTIATTVNPYPAAITGTLGLSAVTPTTLSDATGGGTWASSNTGVATVGSTTGVVSGVAAGTSIITYALPTTCYVTTTVTVIAPITGSDSVIIGNTITLANATSGGVWSSSNTSIATVGTGGVVTGVSTGPVTITYTYSGGYVVYAFTVDPIQPIVGVDSVLLNNGSTYTDATPGGTWSSSTPAVATVNSSTGALSSVSLGTTTLTYTVGSAYVTKVVTVTPVSPIVGADSVLNGNTSTYTDATPGGTWSSSTPGVATINSSTGLLTSVSLGTTTLTYTVGSAYATKVVTVSPVSPIVGADSVLNGNTSTYTDATPGGTWSSSTTGVATIDPSTGVLTSVSLGTTTLTYTVGSAYTTKVVTISALAPIVGVDSVLLNNGSTYTDATTGGTWSSSTPGVATINSSTGALSSVSLGTTTLTYTVGSAFVTKVVSVTPVSPIVGADSVLNGNTSAYTDATPGGTWSSSTTGVATINSSTGVLTSVSVGTTTLTYTVGSAYATKVVTVTPVSPIVGADSVLNGNTSTYTDATPGGTWSSSTPGVATINSSTGLLTSVSLGTTTLTYTVGSAYATKVVTVSPVSPIVGADSVLNGNTSTYTDATPGGTWSSSTTGVATIDPSTGVLTSVSLGTTTLTYTVGSAYTTKVVTISALAPIVGADSVLLNNGSTYTDATSGGTWSSSTPGVATVNSSTGALSSVSLGTTTLTYTVGSAYVTKVVSVTPVAPIVGADSVLNGNTSTYTDATPGGTWSSSTTGVATINSSTGVLTSVSVGTTTLTYTVGSAYATKVVTVSPVSPIVGADSVLNGNTSTYTDATPGGTWSSSTTGVATIDPSTGVLTSVSLGTTTLTYTVGSAYTTKVVTISALAPIVGVDSVLLNNGSTYTDATTGGTWSSSTPGVATINSSTGALSSVSLGTTTLTYTVGSAFVTKVVSVTPVSPIVGADSVLNGNTSTYTDATPGGTWSSSTTGVATIDPSTGVLTSVSLGTTTLTYTVGSAYTTKVVTISALSPIVGVDSVLLNNGSTYTDATTGGTWSSSTPGVATVNSSTGALSSVSLGTTTLTYTVGSAFVTKVVSVDPVAPIVGVDSIYYGTTGTYTDATPGGVWSSSTPAIGTIDASGVLTGISAGTTTLTYTIGSAYATKVVTVAPVAPIVGFDSVIITNTITLTDASPGGTWSSSNTSVATIGTDGVLTGVTLGTTTITYTVSGGAYVTKVVTVAPLQPITGPTSVTTGNTITLADATAGGTWSSSNTGTATIGTNGVVTGVHAGAVTITYTLGGTYVTYTITINPNVSSFATPSATNVCPGVASVVTINSTSIGAGTYTVTFNLAGSNTSTGDTATLTMGATSGTFSVSPSYLSGVGSNTLTITAVGGPGGSSSSVATANVVTFTTYPTPSAVVGSHTVCEASVIGLSDITAGLTSWTSSDTNIAKIGVLSGVVTGMSAGTALITYTIYTACYTTHVVTVNPRPAVISGTTTLCSGNTTTLSSSPAGGTWSSSSTAVATVGTDGTVTGVIGGLATIYYTLSTGCNRTTQVTVGNTPQAISGTLGICPTGTTTLSSYTTGQTWSSADTTIATVNSSTGLVTGLTVGTSTISYTHTSGCYRTAVVSVVPTPPAIAGSALLCVGSTSTLTNTSSGGTWATSNASVASVNSSTGVVTAVSAGNATITYRVGGSGCYNTVVVTVNPALTSITGSTNLCVGATTTLSNSTSGGTWSSSNTARATVDNVTGVVTGVAAGTVTITYTTTPGCYKTFAMNINALPTSITGTAQVCQSSTTTLTGTVGGGTWLSSNTSRATVNTSGVVTGVSAGTANITYTLSTGCYLTQEVTVNSLPGAIGGTLAACVGGSTTLTDTTAGGTWASSNTSIATIGTAGDVAGIAAGTATITYTSALGCRKTATVTVVALPSAISGTMSICSGSTSALTSSPSGGTWSSSNTGVATVGSASGVVSAVSVGTSRITYMNSTGCYVTAVVTVNTAATASTGDSIVCVGQTIPLSNSVSGGTWTSSNTARATVDSATGIVTGVSSGTVYITYTVGAGCFATKLVSVNSAVATITGTAAVCLGSTTTLSHSASGGTWSSSNTGVATVNSASGLVTSVSAGTTVVTYTLSSGCYQIRVVTVNPLPTAIGGVTSICEGAHAYLTNSGIGGTWSSSDTTKLTINSISGWITGVASGAITITYTLPTGCQITEGFTVNPLPAVIVGSSTICTGNTATFTDATSGGVWASSDTFVAPITTLGVATAVIGGQTTIYYTLPTGCQRTTIVTVNNTPQAITGTLELCPGGTTTLSSYTTGQTWSSQDTTVATINASTGVVTGVGVGTSTISYIHSNGCYQTAVVTMDALPPSIGGPSALCQGSTATFTNGVSGGTWSSSNSTVASINTATGLATASTTGVATITYKVSGSGCYSTLNLTVNASLAAITGTNTVCPGTTTTLSHVVGGGTWSSSNTAAATVDGTTGVVTGVASGTTTITYTAGTGCYKTIIVTVNPLPTAISGTLTTCVSSATILSGSPSGGTWSSANASIATVTAGGVVTGVASGNVNITYQLSTGCYISSVVTVNSQPSPITGNLNLCVGSANTLSDATPSGVWSSSNAAVGTIDPTTGAAMGIAVGTTNISYTVSPGCRATAIATVNAIPTTISGIQVACVGTKTTLYLSGTGGTWSSGNTAIATVGTNGVVTGTGVGIVPISYTTAAGCSRSVDVTVNTAMPLNDGDSIVCLGQYMPLSNGSTGGTWTSSASYIASVNSSTGVVTAISLGTATITYNATNLCKVTTQVTVNPTFANITGANSVCIGSTTTFTHPTSGGYWLSSNTAKATVDSATGVITGISAGSTTITYVYTSGCIKTKNLTIYGLPPTIGGSNQICVDAHATLTNGYGGGTWASSDTSKLTVGSASGWLTGISEGTATISYTLYTGCTITKAMTINGLPAVITGVTSVCSGDTTQLSDATPGGTWLTSDTFVTRVDTAGRTAGIIGGSATIYYTLSTGCRRLATVTVGNTPAAITGTLLLCPAGTSSLSSYTSGMTWSSGNVSVATISSTGVVTGVDTGTATISYTHTSGCVRTAQVTVNALPNNITGPSTLCVGSTENMTDPTSGGTWSSSSAGIASINSSTGVATASSTGNVTISYKVAGNGCYSTLAVTVDAALANITGTTTVCTGAQTTLSHAITGGTWSSADTTIATVDASTGVVTGVATGTVKITYASSAGCYKTTNVTVKALPSAISGNATVCQGATSTLTSGPTGGSWSSSNTGLATVGIYNGIVTGISSGVVNISYTVSGAGCYAVKEVTVNTALDPITGTAAICVGGTSTLSHTVSGGTWISSNTAKATIDSATGVVTAVASGTSVVTYIVAGGCYSTRIVTVNALPVAISGTAAVCEGSSSTLYGSPAGGTWSSSNLAVGTIVSTSGLYRGITAGTTTVTYTLGTGCILTKDVTVNAMPSNIAGVLSTCIGGTTALSDTVSGGTWASSNSGIASVDASGIVTGVATGNAILSYTLPTGCRKTATVSIGTYPYAITGTLAICVGSTSSLSSATAGDTWSSSNSSVATIDSATGVVTGVSSGTATISYIHSADCIRTAVVTVNAALPTNTGNSVMCLGQTITLSNTTSGGTWSSANTAIATVNASTGVVTGVSTGAVNITYRVGGGCYSVSGIAVDAAMSAISGTTSVCVGDSVTLSHSDVGGTWSSSNTARATVNSTTGVVTGVAYGAVTITYTNTTGCFKTTSFTVKALPYAIMGTLSVCEGAIASMIDYSAGGTWSVADTSIASVVATSGRITGLTAGTTMVTYTWYTGCSVTAVATVNTTPSAISGAGVVCAGNTLSLSSTPSGGTWSSSNTYVATVSSTGTLTGVTGGSSTVDYTTSSGCRVSTVVTVGNVPSAISGTTLMCNGSKSQLTSYSGVAWSSSNSSVASVGSTGLVTANAEGTATISYVHSSGCPRTVEVTVNPALPSISGGTVVCVGQYTYLSHSVTGGTWSSSAYYVAAANSSTGSVYGYSAGTATITYKATPGCQTTTVVTVNPAMSAAIAGTTYVCAGSTTALTYTSMPGGVWSSSTPAIGTVDASGVVTGFTAGTTVITYSLAAGCNKTAVVTVRTAPDVIVGPSAIVVGDTVTLTNTVTGGNWFSSTPAKATVNGSTGLMKGMAAGTTLITYRLSTGCQSTLNVSVTTSKPTEGTVVDNDAFIWNLYPNPTDGVFNVETNTAGIFVVYALDGRQVADYQLAAGVNHMSLPATLASGSYLGRFVGEDGNTTAVRMILK